MPDELWHLHGAWWLGADVLPGRAATPPRLARAARRIAGITLRALAGAALLGWLLPGLPWQQQPVPGPLLQQAQARGELVVGVHAYARATPPGRPLVPVPDPAEAALAAELGRALGVPVRLRHLPAPAPGGDAGPPGAGTDLVFGNAGAARPRAATVHAPAIPPGTLLTLRFTPVDRLGLLAGKTACASQDSPYAPALARAGAELRRYPSALQALLAFRRGECAAVAADAALAARVMRLPEWRFFAAAPLLLHGEGPLLTLPRADSQSVRYLEQWLASRQRDGQLARWRDAAAGEAAFNTMLVESGLICH
ncbi:transporter substrate-binding domain-containing protein [Cupriavidus sp. 2TAF22]|uniref:ABC transporter substrate-binding protein n=1 Tax=unclassified Cupriavidus TaxID=2640874 RepID=UPI003F8EFD62